MDSDNLPGADNQQERPGIEQWVVGFVDGEGCFSISVVRNTGCLLGWQVQHEFSVTQAAPSEVRTRTSPASVRVWADHREPAQRQPSSSASALLCEAPERVDLGHRAALRATPTDNRQTSRLRGVRVRPPDDGGGRASHGRRATSDRCHHRADEPAWAVSVPGILRGHTPTSSDRCRAEDMVLAPRRRGEQLERNSLSGEQLPRMEVIPYVQSRS